MRGGDSGNEMGMNSKSGKRELTFGGGVQIHPDLFKLMSIEVWRHSFASWTRSDHRLGNFICC